MSEALRLGRSVAARAPAGALAAACRRRRLRPVPDQREGAAVLDEVSEDRRRKGGVVEPDLVVLATALLGRLGPGRAELDRAGVEAVGGSAFLLALDGLQRDLGAEVEGLDLALERAVAVEGEGADGGHDVISCLSLKGAPRDGTADPDRRATRSQSPPSPPMTRKRLRVKTALTSPAQRVWSYQPKGRPAPLCPPAWSRPPRPRRPAYSGRHGRPRPHLPLRPSARPGDRGHRVEKLPP